MSTASAPSELDPGFRESGWPLSLPHEVRLMVCRKCGADELRRQSRHGFLQHSVYPMFGYYPWECAICRKTLMYRKQFNDSDPSGLRQSDAQLTPTMQSGQVPRPDRPASRRESLQN